MNPAPIGIFDSGVGGLTVYHALKQALPHEDFIYLGDTARVPYGTKTESTIIRYSEQAADILIKAGVKCLVIACNTATGPALSILQNMYPEIPIFGVIEPGAKAAIACSRTEKIALIATAATIRGGRYEKVIQQFADIKLLTKPAPLLVALAEEGLIAGEIPEKVIRYYLEEWLNLTDDARPDTLILGCTHFPVLKESIKKIVGDTMQVVDSAESLASQLKQYFEQHSALQNASHHLSNTQFWVTDGVERFRQVAHIFLQDEIPVNAVQLVDLG